MWVSTKIPREKLKELVQKYKEAKVQQKITRMSTNQPT